jgi:hypothetical protein
VILFFDRNVGTAIPKALAEYLKPPGITIEYHQKHFDMASPDDVWLPIVGSWGWVVIGQDHNYHNRSPELAALKAHNIGAFYLWGADATKWEAMQCFAKGYDNILRKATVTAPPYIFRVEKHGGLNEIYFA